MKSLLTELLTRTTEAPLDFILVLGAGVGADLPALRKLRAGRLVLVEAHPRLAERLNSAVRRDLAEESRALAVVAEAMDKVQLLALNNLRESGTKQATRLLDHFPNLAHSTPMEVPAVNFADLLQHLPCDSKQNNLLVIDTPGQVAELLLSLPMPAVHLFRWIILRCGTEPLYADDIASSELLSLMSERGFRQIAHDNETPYPHIHTLLERDELQVQLYQLTRRLNDAERQLALALEERGALQEKIPVLTTSLEQQTWLANERQHRIDELELSARLAQEQAAAQRSHIETLEATAVDAAEQMRVLRQQVKETLEQVAQQTQSIAGQQQALDAAKTERAEAVKALEESQAGLVQLRADLKEKTAQITRLAAELEDCSARQRRQHEELLRAEGQIELIKDLILREQGI